MIPKTLRLKNFLSYGANEEIINFEPYNLICLVGKNGHGKSALLDAITWVLWGQARKTKITSRADQGLLHLGQKSMHVVFDFNINSQNYRVRREFIQTKSKPFLALDFGIIKENNEIIHLTDKTIKLTQEKIEQTLGLNYETFVNSAFLRQNQSNEFSQKTPKERKDILASILQLNKFETLKKTALESIKELLSQKINQETICNRITQELMQLTNIENENNEKKLILETIIKSEKNIKIELEDCLKKKIICIKNEENYKNYTKILLEKQKIKNELLENLEINKAQYKDLSEKIANFENNSLETKKLELTAALKKENEKVELKLKLKEEYIKLKETKNNIELTLKQKLQILLETEKCKFIEKQEALKLLDYKKSELIKKISILKDNTSAIEEKINNQTKEIIENKQNENIVAKKNKILNKYRNIYKNYFSELSMLYKKEKKITHKLKTIIILNNSSILNCTECEKILNCKNLENLKTKLLKKKNELQIKIKNLSNKTIKIKKKIIFKEKELETIKKNYYGNIQKKITTESYNNSLLQYQIELNTATINLKALDTENTNYNNVILEYKKNINEIESKISNCNNSNELSEYNAQIATILEKNKILDYNPNFHTQLKKELEELNLLLQNEQQQYFYSATAKQLEISITTQNQNLEKIELEITTLKNHLKQLELVTTKKDSLAATELELHKKLEQLQQQKIKIHNEISLLETKQTTKAALVAEKNMLEVALKKIKIDIFDYNEIAKACSSDGIQAVLIEAAIPELEEEANLLLSKLTNNNTTIFIESLRDLKSGGSRETLDIKIADSVGVRQYELFSGGEAFRIDFALRIAISKLLARHSGTTLQTIFIDEGFGSQDDESLQLIMDCIYKIQADFEKIIIVSHLSSMKEAFPVQFLVEKKSTGSTVSILE